MSDLVITRALDAPRDIVFKAWSDPDQLAKWWGPAGFEMCGVKLDFRPGGMFHYGMKAPTGDMMYGRFIYGEIIPSQKIEFFSAFSDQEGNAVRTTMLDNWPLEIHNVLELTEQDGVTKLTLTGKPHNALASEIETFTNMRTSMEAGFAGTFAQLEDFLSSQVNTMPR